MFVRSRTLALATAMLVAACAPKSEPAAEKNGDDPAKLKSTIEAANASFMTAMGKGDAAGAAANYDENAIVMMPNAPAWRGKANITKALAEMFGQVTVSNGGSTTEDVVVTGDYAIETGSGRWTMTPKKGKAMTDTVKYVTVWKKQADGSWKILRDINNSDRAAGQ